MKANYKEIDAQLLENIKGGIWSVENRAAHGAGDRSVEYIGSRTEETLSMIITGIARARIGSGTGPLWTVKL